MKRFAIFSVLFLLVASAIGVSGYFAWNWERLSWSTAEAIIRVNRRGTLVTAPGLDLAPKRDFEVYKETHAAILDGEFVKNAFLRKPEVSRNAFVMRLDDPQAWLNGALDIDSSEGTELILISLKAPEDCAEELLDLYLDTYLTEVVDTEKQQTYETLAELKSQLVEVDRSVSELRRRRGTDTPPFDMDLAATRLAERLSNLQDRRLDIEIQIAQIKELEKRARIVASNSQANDDSFSEDELGEVESIAAEDDREEGFTAAGPFETEQVENEEVAKLRVASELISTEIRAVTQHAKELGQNSVKIAGIDDEIKSLLTYRQELDLKIESGNLAYGSAGDSVTIIQNATLPDTQIVGR